MSTVKLSSLLFTAMFLGIIIGNNTDFLSFFKTIDTEQGNLQKIDLGNDTYYYGYEVLDGCVNSILLNKYGQIQSHSKLYDDCIPQSAILMPYLLKPK